MKKDNTGKNVKKLPKVKFFWKKKERPVNSDTIFINAKTVTFIVLSLISGFINLVCISNLTKSPYVIGWLESKNCGWIRVPGAAVLGAISIGLDVLKCIHAVQINTLAELIRKTNDGDSMKKTIKKLHAVRIKWICSYILYVALSVLTGMSLAMTSVGSAIRENETVITSITEDYNELSELKKNQKDDKNDKRDITRGNIEGNKDARETAQKEVETYWGYVVDYRTQRDKIENNEDLSDEEKTEQIDKLRSKCVNRVPKINSKQADYISQTEFKQLLQNISVSLETDTSNTKVLEDLIAENSEEINAVIFGLEGRYVRTDKTPVTFLDDSGNPVSITTAMQILKTLKNEYQIGGNSDIGSSAKMFTIAADAWNAGREEKDTSGFGTTEKLIMAFLLFLTLLVEVGINQVSTKSKISRKLWGQFSQYYPKDFDVDHFMIGVYIDQVRADTMSIEECEKRCKEAVELMKYTPEYFISKYGDKILKDKYKISDVNIEEPTKKQLEEIARYKAQLEEIKKENEILKNTPPEIKEVIKEVPVEKIVEVEKEVIKEVPKIVEKEVIKEIPVEKAVRKIVKKDLSNKVDEKAAELDDLIKDI